jgi:hypothetical protein
MASLASSASIISPLGAKSSALAGKPKAFGGVEKTRRALVVRAAKEDSESRWVDAPAPPQSALAADAAKVSSCRSCRVGRRRGSFKIYPP